MTTAQINTPGIRVAINEAQRQRALVDAVVTPELRKMMQDYGKQVSETLNLQVKVRNLLPPSLETMMREQNQRIAEMLDNAGLRQAFAGIDFELPEGWAEQVAAYHERLATEVAAEEEADPASGLGRLAEEREAIIICLQRIGHALEGFAYLPDSPIPHFVGYLIFTLAVLGSVANEKLSERDADEPRGA